MHRFAFFTVAAIFLVACSGDISTPVKHTNFVPPPRTPANTWNAPPGEQQLINQFLARYSAERAGRYRETLMRTDAFLEMAPSDQEGNRLLKAIYAARRQTQMAMMEQDRLHP